MKMKLVTPATARLPLCRWPWQFRSPIAIVSADPGCSFCGKSHRDGVIVVAAPEAAICDRCTARAARTVARALGQSDKGIANALGVLYRPGGKKARAELRRSLIEGAPPD